MTISPTLQTAIETMNVEADAIRLAALRLGDPFETAVTICEACAGKIIVTGVGKSGIAARKIASTLTSIGNPSVFLHPSEAMHGDLGIVQSQDVIIALSNGGESEELLAILPSLNARHVPIIAIVGNQHSTLATKADVTLDASIEREACPLNLAPTTSVVVAIALGDALAMTLQARRGFKPEDYAFNHPGGRLGRRLTLRVQNVMQPLPSIGIDAGLMDVLAEISKYGMGAVCVTDVSHKLLGLITDYDIRRAFQHLGAASFNLSASEIMNSAPQVCLINIQLAADAMELMEDRPRPLSVAPVLDEKGQCVGMVRIHDFVRAGL